MKFVVGETRQGFGPSSNRTFGLFLASVGIVVAILLALNSFHELAYCALCAVAVLIFLSIKADHKLNNLNLAWTKFGILLGKITNPIILSFVFFVIVLPFATISRVMGRDILQVNPKIQQDSYWRLKEKESIDLCWLKRQF